MSESSEHEEYGLECHKLVLLKKVRLREKRGDVVRGLHFYFGKRFGHGRAARFPVIEAKVQQIEVRSELSADGPSLLEATVSLDPDRHQGHQHG
jgi:hypothetical protein